jgi:hypothetical protein
MCTESPSECSECIVNLPLLLLVRLNPSPNLPRCVFRCHPQRIGWMKGLPLYTDPSERRKHTQTHKEREREEGEGGREGEREEGEREGETFGRIDGVDFLHFRGFDSPEGFLLLLLLLFIAIVSTIRRGQLRRLTPFLRHADGFSPSLSPFSLQWFLSEFLNVFL